MNRRDLIRNFISLFPAISMLGGIAFAENTTKNTIKTTNLIKNTTTNSSDNIVFKSIEDNAISIDTSQLLQPDILKEGDTVAFTAPASPVSIGQIRPFVSFMESKGCKVIVGDTIKKQRNVNKYFSAEDTERASELNEFINNKDIKAIICGRGGYGVMRILPLVDYFALRHNPKIIMGYSDITALSLAVYRQANIVTYHGPVGSSNITKAHKTNIENLLFERKNPLIYKDNDMLTLGKSKVKSFRGKLQGGNLSLIAATMGTPYEIDLADSVFFFEDVSVLAHTVDRMLTQLWIADKLQTTRGIVVGKIKNMNRRGNFYPNMAFTIKEVIEDIANKLGIPCVYNVSFGHESSEIIFPYGIEAEVDINTKTISLYP